MAYKDKDRQREAVRIAKQNQRRREREGMTPEGMTSQGMTVSQEVMVIPKPERTAKGNIRVSKPGDDDYDGICHKDDLNEWSATKLTATKPKRGLDIKCFEDLPPDVQETIDRMSVFNGKIDRAIKIKRTEAAIRYQHLFPDRYHSTGITNQPLMMSKPQ